MSIATDLTGLFTKALSFFSAVLTKTASVDATFTKLAPATKAAILATFYDTTKTISTAAEAVGDAETGNVLGAITLSQATVAMVKGVVADGKADLTALANIVSAIKAEV